MDSHPSKYSAIDNEEGNNASSAYNQSDIMAQSAVTSNTKYVDQNANPINIPPQASVLQQSDTSYVDESGNTVATPTAQHVTPPAAAVAPTPRSIRQQKTASAVLGGIAFLLLFIGLCVNRLSRGDNIAGFSTPYFYTEICTWTALTFDCDSGSYEKPPPPCRDVREGAPISYSDLCHFESHSDVVEPKYCATRASAAWALVTMIISTIFALIGVIYVQPCSPVEPCVCKTNPQWTCGRASFSLTVTFSILSFIIWTTGDDICSDDYLYNSYIKLGGTMICQVIAVIFAFIGCILAK